MKLAELTWTQVEEYLQKDDRILIPIGSTEQHGPTGLIGTDFLTATSIAEKVGDRLKILVAPSINYGMAFHHLGFPGSAALTPTTLIAVVCDVIDSFARHGFEKIYFVNGHGGNIASITSAFCEVKTEDNELELACYDWWRMPEVQEYEKKNFGDQNGFHATIGEISVTMHTHPEPFKDMPKANFKVVPAKVFPPLGPQEYRKHYPDGRMGSNPALATKDHGHKIMEIAINSICNRIDKK
jgi:creatinine amidohydrolase